MPRLKKRYVFLSFAMIFSFSIIMSAFKKKNIDFTRLENMKQAIEIFTAYKVVQVGGLISLWLVLYCFFEWLLFYFFDKVPMHFKNVEFRWI